MSDIIDRASEREAEFLAEALARHQRQPENRGSLKNCTDCGEPIPEARRQAVSGCLRCIDCQELHEKGY